MRFPLLFCCSLLAFVPGTIARAADSTPAEPTRIEFNRDIRPILSDTCYTCHGPDAAKRATELRLDQQESALGDLGGYRAIVPGNLDESELWQRVISDDPNERMPPANSGRQLTAGQIELLRRWIEQGASFQTHWSFIPVERPPVPEVTRKDWIRNPIDAFILARLEREGLSPSPEASKETLIRRVTLDLTGLPPTLEEIDAFLADESPDAYERLVDRLFASPRYGERMVLEWLDAARYADSNGYQTDGTRAMWPWRDWVIAALNSNMPFDQFTVEQIAGDLLPEPTLQQKIATGFNRNHMLNGEGGRIAEESRVEYVVDRVETTSTVWLGLTVGCARCHDHKYDPVSQKEFYQIYAYFNNIAETGGVDRRSGTAAPVIELPTPEQTARQAELQKALAELDVQLKANAADLRKIQGDWEQTVEIGSLPEALRPILNTPAAERNDQQKQELEKHFFASQPERQPLQKRYDETKKQLDDLNRSILITMVMEERPEPRETFILLRGAYDQYGEKVTSGVPEVLPALPDGVPNNRLGFARWLVDPANPLTARVTVNRYWQTFFGTGLVKTPEDFGAQGELPSHPQLLDWLAAEFVAPNSSSSAAVGAWDVKALQRLIVTSATYRQQSNATPELLEKDPENRLLARASRYRMNSHVLRDQALAVSGLLVEQLGGPPVKPYQPPGIWEDFSFGKIVYQQDHGARLYRRSLYTFWRRSVGPTMMFDTGARQVCTVRQPRTNTPLHSLVLLNDVTYVEAARVFAQRLLREAAGSDEERLSRAFRTVTSRHPTASEKQILVQALARLRQQYAADRAAVDQVLNQGEFSRDTRLDPVEVAAYTGIGNLLLNLDEVLNRE